MGITVWEGVVTEENGTHQRGGAHLESPGVIEIASQATMNGEHYNDVMSEAKFKRQTYTPLTIWWGAGVYEEKAGHFDYDGGIYMASPVADSTRVWGSHIQH